MEQEGYRKTNSQGLEEFVSLINDRELKNNAYHFVAEFEKIFYKDKKLDQQNIKILKNSIRKMKRISKKKQQRD